jgi:hypothetical protein
MKDNLTQAQVEREMLASEGELHELDGRAFRFWERVRIPPCLWTQSQYPNASSFWVIGLLGSRCLYFNFVEGGWGWGRFTKWGTINEYHWQQDEIHHVVFQTLFSIDEGGNG